MGYSIADLKGYGFIGFVPFRTWTKRLVLDVDGRDSEGVYVIARESVELPAFIEERHHKPRPIVRTAQEAAARWVDGEQVLYFGKAPLRKRPKGLANRLAEYHAHGFGSGAQHYGGKLIWQLANTDELIVGWKGLGAGESAAIESGLIKGFALLHGVQPYANTGAPLRSAAPIGL